MNTHLKEYELVWHLLESDRAWFDDHPDRDYRVRAIHFGEGTATRLKGRLGQHSLSWFAVRRDLEYATFNPVAVPPDDEKLCRLLFQAHVGLGGPKSRYLKQANRRWTELLMRQPPTKERDLALTRLAGAERPHPFVRKTGAADDQVFALTLWQD
jgi:hypothetical protein